jgi:N-methylhydantoinase A
MTGTGSRFICGVDTGGTFTDCVAIDESGRLWTAKTSSTPPNFDVGFFAGLAALAEQVELGLEAFLGRTAQLVHGTTVATNALVERRGARVGLIATAGHRDAIFVMRGVGRVAGLSPDEAMRTLDTDKPPPIVRKADAVEVLERVDWNGEVVVPLDEERARTTIGQLIETGVDAIAVGLLWSFRNPIHELRLAELIEELQPGTHVSLSHRIAPRQGEYERTAATVIDAYVKPETVSYLTAVEQTCREKGYPAPLLVVQCDGNIAPLELALQAPVLTLQSGPAAGLEASRLMALATGRTNGIVFDMGGTSCDVGLIVDGSALRRTTNVVSQYEYFTPSVEIESIGVGGGSVAWIDDITGGLHVGPRSAGADPGPACYGRGGAEPTVTDADLLLGRLDADSFLGGKMRLDRDAAFGAIARLARRLGLKPEALAAGISRLAEVQMAEEIRKLTVAKGYDPRLFTVFAYGGAGPVHAGAVARELGLSTVVVPMAGVASLWSAFGAATSDLGVTVDLSINETEPFDPRRLVNAVEMLRGRALEALKDAGDEAEVAFSYSAGMRYRAQVNDVWVPLDAALEVERLTAAFESEYEVLYGRGTGYRAAGIEIASLRCVATIPRPVEFAGMVAEVENESDTGEVGRLVYWVEHEDFSPTRAVRGSRLGRVDGPAIVELANTAIVVHPGQCVSRDSNGNLVLENVQAQSLRVAPVAIGAFDGSDEAT